MPNDYFQFKRFRIQQARAAMKVSTDACIQAAATVQLFQDNGICYWDKMLDIGCGTNLLTLALMQELNIGKAMSIELDEGAYLDAVDNALASPWTEQISVMCGDVLSVDFTEKYDLIITNPPFYHQSLKGSSKNRNNARHTDSLPLDRLADRICELISEEGVVCIMLPPYEWELFRTYSQEKLHIAHLLQVYPSQQHPANRIIVWLSKNPHTRLVGSAALYIYEQHPHYTEVFKNMMKPYYLNF